MSVGEQTLLINKVLTKSREIAAVRIMKLSPEVLMKANQAKIEAINN
jgi:hypothetical protein